MIPRALSIAGSDPSGGAGLQADLKTFHQLGVYGMSAVTLLTVQNTVSVQTVEVLTPALVAAQIRACISDIGVDAAKTGALGSAEVIAAVAALAPAVLVVDPVMISKHGASLLREDAVAALKQLLLPKATLLTPNVPEAEVLLGRRIASREDMAEAARAIGGAVLLKGGHLSSRDASDVLWDGQALHWLDGERFATAHTHGTGCTFSAAITAHLARGLALLAACAEAKAFITRAIRHAPGLGAGHGPIDHWAKC